MTRKKLLNKQIMTRDLLNKGYQLLNYFPSVLFLFKNYYKNYAQ